LSNLYLSNPGSKKCRTRLSTEVRFPLTAILLCSQRYFVMRFILSRPLNTSLVIRSCVSIFAVDEMGSRIDDLEKSIGDALSSLNHHVFGNASSNNSPNDTTGDLMTQAGIEEQGTCSPLFSNVLLLRLHSPVCAHHCTEAPSAKLTLLSRGSCCYCIWPLSVPIWRSLDDGLRCKKKCLFLRPNVSARAWASFANGRTLKLVNMLERNSHSSA
jgi:hypothetical protein